MTQLVQAMDAWAYGRWGLARFFGYLGAAIGALLLATAGGAAKQSAYVLVLMSAQGLVWVGTGALVGMGLGIGLALLRPSLLEAKVIRGLTPWLDGIALAGIVAYLASLFEPAQVDYRDQSNLVSGRLIMLMNVAFLFSAVAYLATLFATEGFIAKLARTAAQVGVLAGGAALLLRWHESYLLGEDIGHAPVSNLYEVFVLLFVITGAIHLALEKRHGTRALGAFVMLLIAAGVFFLLWMDSHGHGDIRPLVPALQSYWMKIHVPMNFIGYGAFAVACAAGGAYLLRERMEQKNPKARLLKALPTLDQLDQLMYKAVAIGFPAFTLATILGAAWAAEAWGGYWSWDPKETWALIVWLVYGAWLHMRITHGWRGRVLAWWALAGFLVTLFCFLGVNLYLSGLHSYGRLA